MEMASTSSHDEFLEDLRAMTGADKDIIRKMTMLAARHESNGDIRTDIVRTIEREVTTVCSQLFSLGASLVRSFIE